MGYTASMLPFEEALARGGPLLPAWDEDDVKERTLHLCTIGSAGAAIVASADVPPPGREAMTDRLLDRGLRIGRTYGTMPFVWVMDGLGCTLWSDKGVVAEGTRDALAIGALETPLREINYVRSFIDKADRGHRGVQIVTAAWKAVTVVEEHDRGPHLDPTYGHDNELMDSMWIHYVGTHLASWLSLAHFDESSQVVNEKDLAVRRGALRLASEVEEAPESIGVADLTRSIGRVPPSGGLALRVAADPLQPDRRFLEVRVTTPGGKSASGRRLRQGSPARIAAFLRDAATPRAVLLAMHDLLRG